MAPCRRAQPLINARCCFKSAICCPNRGTDTLRDGVAGDDSVSTRGEAHRLAFVDFFSSLFQYLQDVNNFSEMRRSATTLRHLVSTSSDRILFMDRRQQPVDVNL